MPGRSRNRLIQAADPTVWTLFRQHGRRIEIARGETLHEGGQALRHVYFPDTAVLAVGTETAAGECVDSALIGAEGVFGAPEACGSRLGFARATIQVRGALWRVPTSTYCEALGKSVRLNRAARAYVEYQLVQARQLIVCYARHTVEMRLARVLLELRDRAPDENLQVTQEALAGILGVQRSTVGAAVAALQSRRLIQPRRGEIGLVCVEGLEQAACSCRATLAQVRQTVLADPGEAAGRG